MIKFCIAFNSAVKKFDGARAIIFCRAQLKRVYYRFFTERHLSVVRAIEFPISKSARNHSKPKGKLILLNVKNIESVGNQWKCKWHAQRETSNFDVKYKLYFKVTFIMLVRAYTVIWNIFTVLRCFIQIAFIVFTAWRFPVPKGITLTQYFELQSPKTVLFSL